MIDNAFRARLPDCTGWLIKIYRLLGLTPNQITILGFLIALSAAALIARGHLTAAIAAWWLGRLLDGTDGIYARANTQATPFGAYLDILCDMAAYSSMIVGFAIQFPHYELQWLVILLLYVLCITGALALGALETEGKVPPKDNRGLRLAAGLAEGGETGIAYTLFLLLPLYLHALTLMWIVILAVTVLARSYLAFQELRDFIKTPEKHYDI